MTEKHRTLQKAQNSIKYVIGKGFKKKITAVILAGGSGTRAGGTIPKQHQLLLGIPVIVRTLQVFERTDCIRTVVLVCQENDTAQYQSYKQTYGLNKLQRIVPGGTTRQESAFQGMLAVPDDTDLIAIHDGARCLITPEDIEKVASDAIVYKAATAAIPATDTVKISTPEGGFSLAKNQPERQRVYQIQTPQIFDINLYRAAAFVARNDQYQGTDDCSLIENLGRQCRLTLCSGQNLKITKPEDFILAEALLKNRESPMKEEVLQ